MPIRGSPRDLCPHRCDLALSFVELLSTDMATWTTHRSPFPRTHAASLETPDRCLACTQVGNGPTEAASNVVKRVKRGAF
jgi:hypothetical protein